MEASQEMEAGALERANEEGDQSLHPLDSDAVRSQLAKRATALHTEWREAYKALKKLFGPGELQANKIDLHLGRWLAKAVFLGEDPPLGADQAEQCQEVLGELVDDVFTEVRAARAWEARRLTQERRKAEEFAVFIEYEQGLAAAVESLTLEFRTIFKNRGFDQ